ncbi:MAG: 7,8-didemethyl-8-hydroxy-5-deazariboflavin synthase subunit CofH, partial [Deltaproteobacteria bacterium]|nr:7,8-didemethyl-8-hydroxy-5-deazariboflavin synthase subunit CofH [Deltaproteobacteria bacterium]
MPALETLFEYENPAARLGELFPSISPTVARVLDRVLEEREVSEEEGVILSKVEGEELGALIATADLLRQRKVGDHVTYVVCRNINF